MIDQTTKSAYHPTIGIECHVQFKTATKLFAAVGNDARGAEPNTLVSHICFGMPGALPVLNKKAIELAIRAAIAFRTRPANISIFDRKHYFYPDLPKGYQITQLHHPIIAGGEVEIEVDGQKKTIRLTRAHLEEDAGKNIHPAGADYSLVDLNRAGTPLLEIVSEPDMHSAAEAKAYARELYLLMRYADVSDADLFHGNMRFDVNVSISRDPNKLGRRTETKNLNSFRSVEKAVEYEINRQIELLEKGEKVVQETRGWDDAKQKTFSQRSKEDSPDYRYFPDPDLPPVIVTDNMVENIKSEMSMMPYEYRDFFRQLDLNNAAIEALMNTPMRAQYIKSIIDAHGVEHARRIANWVVNTVSVKLEEEGAEAVTQDVPIEQAVKLSEIVGSGKVSSTAAKDIWVELTTKGGDALEIAETKNLLQVSDEAEIAKIVEQVLKANPKAADDIKSGEIKAIGFLVGQVMKQSKGQANPALAQKLIKKQLKL